jgi:hypothetical protein
VDKDFVFPNPLNPWADPAGFPEFINYNDLSASDVAADFVAIKVGDVNGSAVTNLSGSPDERNGNGQLQLRARDLEVKKGQTIEVPVYGDDQAVLGYQFTLELGEALELLELQEGLAGAENFGYALLKQGALTASWNDKAARVLSSEEPMFTLVLKAAKDLRLSEELAVSSRFTAAEAYGAGDQNMDVALSFGENQQAYRLYQNAPNPFREYTVIGFRLPKATTATIRIWDAQGRELLRSTGDYEAGYHEVRLDEAPVSRLLYYQLQTPDYKATRAMMQVK